MGDEVKKRRDAILVSGIVYTWLGILYPWYHTEAPVAAAVGSEQVRSAERVRHSFEKLRRRTIVRNSTAS